MRFLVKHVSNHPAAVIRLRHEGDDRTQVLVSPESWRKLGGIVPNPGASEWVNISITPTPRKGGEQ